jgi:hypothetical protein
MAGMTTFDSFRFQHSFCFLQPCLTCVNQPKTLAVSEVISFLSLQVFVRKARLKDWREIQGSTLRGILTAGGICGGGRFMRVPSAVSELWHLPGGSGEKWDKLQSVQSVSGIRFEPLTSKIRKKISINPTATCDRNIYSLTRKLRGLRGLNLTLQIQIPNAFK